jgi:hypothetical protein
MALNGRQHKLDSSRHDGRWAITMGDLGMVILGVAVALALPTLHDFLHPVARGPKSPPWVPVIESCEELLQKVCLAFLPVVLWRRSREGGLIRPSELLFAACAAPMVVQQIDREISLGSLLDFRSIVAPSWQQSGTFWLVRCVAWGLFLVSAIEVTAARRKGRDAIASAWLVVAVLMSFAWVSGPADNLTWWLCHWLDPRGAVAPSVWVGVRVAVFLVPALIGAAALRELANAHGRPEPMARLGLTMAGAVLAVRMVVYLNEMHHTISPPGWSPTAKNALFVCPPLIAGVLSLRLVNLYGRRWDEWAAMRRADES